MGDKKNDAKNMKSEHSGKKNDRNTAVLAYLHDLTYLLAGLLLIFLLLFRAVVVSGSSMNNTLFNGDYILVLNNVFYSEPKQGDIIVASKSDFKNGEPIIKRVIATQGQTVMIKDGIVYVDGKIVEYDVILDPTCDYQPEVVKKGHVFCLGDNRPKSKDSRSTEIGQIDCREILGKAVFNILPATSTGQKGFDFSRFGVVS